jgi:hypothetical protein
MTMFHQQPSLITQVHFCLTDNDPYSIYSFRAGDQGVPRFAAQITLTETWVTRSDIGWIADDDMEALTPQWITPVTWCEFHIVDMQVSGIAACNIKRPCIDISGCDPTGGTFRGDCKGNGPATRTQIGDMAIRIGWNITQCLLNRFQGVVSGSPA